MYSQSTETGLDLDLIEAIQKEMELLSITAKGISELKNIITRHSELMYQDSLIGNTVGVMAHAIKIAAYSASVAQMFGEVRNEG